MDLTWAEVATTVVAGLGGMLGVYAMEDGLRMLRRRGLSPERWDRDRRPVRDTPVAVTAAPQDRDEGVELPVPALPSPSPAGGPGAEMAMAGSHGPGGTAGE